MSTRIETVVLDMAGTTVIDNGLVVEAFLRGWQDAFGTVAPESAVEHVRATMGQSKIDVFRHLVSDADADLLNRSFEDALDGLVADGRISPIPGAVETFAALRNDGRRVALTTGFARPTARAIIDALGWEPLVDVIITPADAGRGRPHPDVNLTALLHTGASSVDAIAVVGDTPSDARSGRSAGAGLVIGVLTGGEKAAELEAAGAQFVLNSVADLPELLERQER